MSLFSVDAGARDSQFYYNFSKGLGTAGRLMPNGFHRSDYRRMGSAVISKKLHSLSEMDFMKKQNLTLPVVSYVL